jgi:hypothetical protein
MELFLKTCLLGKIGIVKDFVSVYRYHDSNLINKHRSLRELIAVSDIYSETYKHAQVNPKIKKNELIKWKMQVFDPAMKDIIFCLSSDYSADFKGAMNILCNKANDNLYRYFFDPVFTLKILATQNKWIYQKVRSIKKRLEKKA